MRRGYTLNAVTYYNKVCCTHTTRRLRSPLLWSLMVHLALVGVFYLAHDFTPPPQDAITVEIGGMELPGPAAAPATAPPNLIPSPLPMAAPAMPSPLPTQPLPLPVPRMAQMVSQVAPQLAEMAQMASQPGFHTGSRRQIARPIVPLPAVSTMPVTTRLYHPSSTTYAGGAITGPGGGVRAGAAPFHPYSSSR
jgi:hypothetical protein